MGPRKVHEVKPVVKPKNGPAQLQDDQAMNAELMYAPGQIQALLNQQLVEMCGLMSNHTKQATAFCVHHFEARQQAQLENQELRTRMASMSTALDSAVKTSEKTQCLLNRQHQRATKMLVKRDQEARAALVENFELREQLAATTAIVQQMEDGDELPDDLFVSSAATSPQKARPLSASVKSVNSDVTSSVSQDRMNRALARPNTSDRKAFCPPDTTRPSLIDEMKLPNIPIDDSIIKLGGEDGSSSEESEEEVVQLSVFKKRSAAVMDMKAKMQSMMANGKNVADEYHASGCARWIATHPVFDGFIVGMVALNTIWIGIDASFNDADLLAKADIHFIVMENVFCTLFLLELIIRFAAFRSKLSAFRDIWFVFDFVLVAFMIAETWALYLITVLHGGLSVSLDILRLVRVMKFLRMARLVRLVRNIPEIMILVKGLGAASRSVFFTICLLSTFLYIFAVLFKQLCKDTKVGEQYFLSLGDAMFTLLFTGCLYQDIPQLATALFAESFALGIMLMVLLITCPLTVMNMLVGVLVQVVETVAVCEQEQAVLNYIKLRVADVFQALDENHDKMLDLEEFDKIVKMPDLVRALEEVGIDIMNFIDEPDLIFKGCRALHTDDFVQEMLHFRGSNTATLNDVFNLKKSLMTSMESMLNQTTQTMLKDSKKTRKKTGKR